MKHSGEDVLVWGRRHPRNKDTGCYRQRICSKGDDALGELDNDAMVGTPPCHRSGREGCKSSVMEDFPDPLIGPC